MIQTIKWQNKTLDVEIKKQFKDKDGNIRYRGLVKENHGLTRIFEFSPMAIVQK